MAATESKKQLGIRGEDLACAELERLGMQVLERNWRCRLGEIDIVAAEAGRTGLTLVFCEVKCRSGLGFGHPLEAITYAKMRTLRQLAALWMREHRRKASSIRLDAIGVPPVDAAQDAGGVRPRSYEALRRRLRVPDDLRALPADPRRDQAPPDPGRAEGHGHPPQCQ
jgi:putative endonuclease